MWCKIQICKTCGHSNYGTCVYCMQNKDEDKKEIWEKIIKNVMEKSEHLSKMKWYSYSELELHSRTIKNNYTKLNGKYYSNKEMLNYFIENILSS